MPTHTEAVRAVIGALTNEKTGVLKSLDEIDAVGHRLVHGGEAFSGSVIINDEVIKALEQCNELAPLHNPANIIGINACQELMPHIPHGRCVRHGISSDYASPCVYVRYSL